MILLWVYGFESVLFLMTSLNLITKKFSSGNYLFYFIAFSFILFPFIDSINGYLILSGLQSEGSAGTFGQLSKGFFALVGLIFIRRLRQFNLIILLVAYVFILEFVVLNLHQSFSFFAIGISHSLKLTFPLVLYFLLNEACREYGANSIVEIFVLSGLCYSVILLIAYLMGVGFNTYDEGAFGFKGPFASGNGLSLFLGGISLISLYYSNVLKNNFYLLVSFLIVASSLIVGTKGSIIFLIAYSLLFLMGVGKKYAILVLISSLIFFLYFNEKIFEIFNIVFDVIVVRFNASDSILEFLASSRDGYVADAFGGLKLDNLFILRLIFGMGAIVSFMDPTKVTEFDTLETDFFDVFFFYGVFGLFLYIFFFISAIYMIFRCGNYFVGCIFVLVFSYSALAGHVLFNSMSVATLILPYVMLRNDGK